MIIKIPDSWLREYLDTDATPNEIKEFLTLSGPTVESIEEVSDDYLYTIEVTPNRVDVQSVVGIAREGEAILPRFNKKAELKNIPNNSKLPKIPEGKLNLTAEIKDPKLCPHFLAIVLDNIEIKDSPNFLAERLEKSGFRSLNNVVDVSNYVMLEMGQPLHIFDYDKIEGGIMILRENLNGEKIKTLDGVLRELPLKTIVIQDKNKLIDLCGIMGGENSAVDENTKRVVLFAQRYSPTHIRGTYRTLNLVTEAALLFEKGIDPQGVLPAFNRALELLKKYAQAKIASDVINIVNEKYHPHSVELKISKLQEILAVRILVEETLDILKSLGFKVSLKEAPFEAPIIVAEVPSYRANDVKIPEDLIEEVARIYGYHKIPTLLPEGSPPQVLADKKFYWEDCTKDFLKFYGFFEVVNFSFIGKELLNRTNFDEKNALKIKNPLNKELEYLRISLIPHLLKVVGENKNFAETLKLYEMERIYIPREKTELGEEKFRLSGIIYKEQASKDLFYEAKGIVEGIFNELGIKDFDFSDLKSSDLKELFCPENLWHPSRTAKISINKKEIVGILGEIHPQILANFSFSGREVIFDLDMDTLTRAATDLKTYKPIIEHPPVIEDLSLLVDKKTPTAEIRDALWEALLDYKEVDLRPSLVQISDYYENESLGKNKKSVTFRIFYLTKLRSLSDKDTEKIREKIIDKLEVTFKAKVRRK